MDPTDAARLLTVAANEDLVVALRVLYPDRLPRSEITPFELGVLIGRQSVIDRIQLALEPEEGQPPHV